MNNPGYPVNIPEHRISGLMYPEVDQGRSRIGLVFPVGGRGNKRFQLMLENLIYASAFRHLGTGKPLAINQSICKSIFLWESILPVRPYILFKDVTSKNTTLN